jgi:nitrate reductase cytochrome c-type subunit
MFRLLVMAALLHLPLVAVPAFADEDGPTEKEIMQAEGTPPVIPHKVKESDATKCLACHEKGKKGAPVTPHPERRTCTGCHVPADGFQDEAGGRKK